LEPPSLALAKAAALNQTVKLSRVEPSFRRPARHKHLVRCNGKRRFATPKLLCPRIFLEIS